MRRSGAVHGIRALAALMLAAELLGCATHQEKWTPFLEAKGVSYFYDAATTRRFDNGKVQVNVLEDHPASVIDRRSGQDYVSAKQSWELDCRAKTVSHVSMSEFSGHKGSGADLSDTAGDNKVYADPQTLSAHHSEEASVPVETISADSPEAALLDVVCR